MYMLIKQKLAAHYICNYFFFLISKVIGWGWIQWEIINSHRIHFQQKLVERKGAELVIKVMYCNINQENGCCRKSKGQRLWKVGKNSEYMRLTFQTALWQSTAFPAKISWKTTKSVWVNGNQFSKLVSSRMIQNRLTVLPMSAGGSLLLISCLKRELY